MPAPTPILWRHADEQDAPALAILGGATFLASFAHDHPGAGLIAHIHDAHSADYYRTTLIHPACTVLIGETPLGAPVGYAMITPPQLPIAPTQGRDLELKRIYLLGGWQGGGNGDAAMDLVIANAMARRADRLLLAVYPENERARRFYARHGFEEIGETTFMVGDIPFRDLIYARKL